MNLFDHIALTAVFSAEYRGLSYSKKRLISKVFQILILVKKRNIH